MRFGRILQWIVIFLLALLSPSAVLGETKYIRITADRVNIRASPSTSSPVVAKARKGDVFGLHGKEGKWFKLRMFSVDSRYVHRSLAEISSYVVSLPRQVSTRREIYRRLLDAEGRAETEADRKYPLEDRRGRPIPGNLNKNLAYMWLLSDRYKLEVMHTFRVQAPVHTVIISEGVKSNW